MNLATDEILDITHLPVRGTTRELVLDRSGIIQANIAVARPLMDSAGADLPSSRIQQAAGSMRAVIAGGALTLISSRILGQYVPFGPEPFLCLCAPSIMETERKLEVNPSDFRMWIVLHEQTHRVQFANATWMPSYLLERCQLLVESETGSQNRSFLQDLPSRMSQLRADREANRPTSVQVLNAFSSPEAVAAIAEVNAVMSLLEGHADIMTDRGGRRLIRSVKTIRDRFQARRNRVGIWSVLNKLLGMDAKLAQYEQGAHFCREVLRIGDMDLLNLAFSEPAALPTSTELLRPQQWCERMAGHG